MLHVTRVIIQNRTIIFNLSLIIYPLFVELSSSDVSPDISFPARYGLTNEICYTCPGTVVAPKVQTSTRLSWIPNAFRITEQVEQLTYHRLEDGIQESRRALHYSKLSAVIGHGVCRSFQ